MTRLKEIRKEKGFSIRSLASASGVPGSTISDYENGKIKNLNTKAIESMAKVLKSTIEELKGCNTSIEMKCRNGLCPFSLKNKCTNDVVLEERGTCANKDVIKEKPSNNKALNYLLVDRR